MTETKQSMEDLIKKIKGLIAKSDEADTTEKRDRIHHYVVVCLKDYFDQEEN